MATECLCLPSQSEAQWIQAVPLLMVAKAAGFPCTVSSLPRTQDLFLLLDVLLSSPFPTAHLSGECTTLEGKPLAALSLSWLAPFGVLL